MAKYVKINFKNLPDMTTPVDEDNLNKMDGQIYNNDGVSAKTANENVRRDAYGRARIHTPSHADDIANKGYVDTKANTAENNAKTHAESYADQIDIKAFHYALIF